MSIFSVPLQFLLNMLTSVSPPKAALDIKCDRFTLLYMPWKALIPKKYFTHLLLMWKISSSRFEAGLVVHALSFQSHDRPGRYTKTVYECVFDTWHRGCRSGWDGNCPGLIDARHVVSGPFICGNGPVNWRKIYYFHVTEGSQKPFLTGVHIHNGFPKKLEIDFFSG